jgi:hypothetical protein
MDRQVGASSAAVGQDGAEGASDSDWVRAGLLAYFEMLVQLSGDVMYVGGGVAGLLVGWGICGGVRRAAAVKDWSHGGSEEKKGANEKTASEGSHDVYCLVGVACSTPLRSLSALSE